MLVLQGPEHPVESLTFSPDNTTLYVTQGHHGILAWNVIDRTTTRLEFDGKLLVGPFRFHPDGRWAFGCTAHTVPPNYDGSLLIDLSNGTTQPLNFVPWLASSIAIFPSRSRIVTISEPPYAVNLLRPYSALLLGWTLTPTGPKQDWQREIPTGIGIQGIVPLGERFATADIGWSSEEDRNATTRLTVCNADTGEPETQIVYPRANVDQFLASPDGHWFVARRGSELHVWDANGWNHPPTVVPGKAQRRLQPSAAFHPSGRYFLLTDNKPSVIAFDTSDWKESRKWNWKAGNFHTVTVSPDGTLAAAGGPRGTVVVWDWDL